jgi:hypothetical protein
MFNKVYFIIFVIFLSFSGFAQEGHQHDHSSDSHNNHLGIGVAAAYLSTENVFAPGFHLHYIRQFGHEKQWGIGAGYEAILNENVHNGVNALFNYRPVHFFSLNAGPGVVFGKHESDFEIHPAFHTEAVVDFDVFGVHAGPMIGFGIDPEETHYSVGVHVGLGF